MKKQTEKVIQVALVRWVREEFGGTVTVSKSGNENSQRHLKEGVDVGEPDLWIYDTRGMLRLELKTLTGKLQDSQIDWNEWFDARTWEVGGKPWMTRAVAYGFKEAREIITKWQQRP